MADWEISVGGVEVLQGAAAAAAADSFFGAPQASAAMAAPPVAGASGGSDTIPVQTQVPHAEVQQRRVEEVFEAPPVVGRGHEAGHAPPGRATTKGEVHARRELGAVESIEVVGNRLVDDTTDSPFHLYEIQVRLSSGASWHVHKRFKQLRAFHGCIQYFPICEKLTPIPSTPIFSRKLNLVEKRSKELNVYFKGLLSVEELQETHAFKDFFEVPTVGPNARQYRILIPLPDVDFDPTECAVPWKKLRQHGGFSFTFATEEGKAAQADPMQLRKEAVIFGALGADVEAKLFYSEMAASEEFQHPIRYTDIHPEDYDGLWLTGGHAKGMRQYLESDALQQKIVPFMTENKPVSAICHGSLLLARCKNPENEGKSVLFNRRTTTLCKTLERLGHAVTSWKHGDLYRTYEEYCEDEVRRHLKDPDTQYLSGPFSLGLTKGTAYDDGAAFVVDDGNYVSGRWPGDAYLLAAKFVQLFHW